MSKTKYNSTGQTDTTDIPICENGMQLIAIFIHDREIVSCHVFRNHDRVTIVSISTISFLNNNHSTFTLIINITSV